MSQLPCFDVADLVTGHKSESITVPADAVIYSEYTLNPVWTGSMPSGIPNDAPFGDKNFGKNYHVIQKRRDVYYVHAPPPFFAGNGYGGFGW